MMKKFFVMTAVLASTVAGMYAQDIKISDTFIDASNWNSDQYWRLTDNGKMCGSNTDGSFLFLKKNDSCGNVSMDIDITVIEARCFDWKVAGITFFTDDNNFWSLNLVEGPDKDGKKHYVELREMRNGKWGADANLTSVMADNGGFDWQYNTVYRMSLAINGDTITGKLLDKSTGKVISQLGFKLTGDALKCGRPALRVSAMTANFDNAEIVGGK